MGYQKFIRPCFPTAIIFGSRYFATQLQRSISVPRLNFDPGTKKRNLPHCYIVFQVTRKPVSHCLFQLLSLDFSYIYPFREIGDMNLCGQTWGNPE